jgi:hypothetical protein
MIQIKLIKSCKWGEPGEIINISKAGGQAVVSQGYAEFLDVKKEEASETALKEKSDTLPTQPAKTVSPPLVNSGKQVEFVEFVEIKELMDVYKQVFEVYSEYLDTSPQNKQLLSLWAIGTYFHNQFYSFPLLLLNAQRGSGKTRTLKLTSAMSKGGNGSVNTSLTETALFRHEGGIMCLDEQENIGQREKGNLRELLNCAYKKGNKVVRYRERRSKEGKDYEKVEYAPFYPIAMANIAGLDDVLGDRTIQLVLIKSQAGQTRLIEDFLSNDRIKNIREGLGTYGLVYSIPQDVFKEWNLFNKGGSPPVSLKNIFEKVYASEIVGRPLELFFPLFLIAHLCGELDSTIALAREYCDRQTQENTADDYDERLKAFVREKNYQGFVPLSLIVSDFRGSIPEPEAWINARWAGRALKRMGLVSKKRLVQGATQVLVQSALLTLQTLPALQTQHTLSTIPISTNSTNNTNNTLKNTIDEDDLP